MLKDVSGLNPKGHVKVEIYNDRGTIYTKEKHNLVVQDANKIIANMIADPAKVVRINQVDKGDALTTNGSSLFSMNLTIQHEKEVVFSNNYGATNTVSQFSIEELKGVTSIDEVTVGEDTLVLNEDVFLEDAENGVIRFATAPTEDVTIKFHRMNNPYMRIIEGTEIVKVDGVVFKRGAVASNTGKTYQIDYRTGKVLFSGSTEKVEVMYDYNMNYALGFMSIGGKPNADWPNYQPIDFGESHKLDIDMKNEFAGSRMPVQYPASISQGATELDPAIPTQSVNTVLKADQVVTIADNGDGATKELTYSIPNLHDDGSGMVGRLLHEIVSVHNETKATDIPVEQVTVETNTMAKVELTFQDSDVEIGDVVKVNYRLKLNDLHLRYQLSQSPVIELISVRHTAAADSKVTEYLVLNSGLKANEGDVWISNSGTGTIQFASGEPTGVVGKPVPPRVETPGQLTVEYKVNSGTVVKFVADFPKGVPAPTLESDIEVKTIVSGQTSVTLKNAIAKDETGAFIAPAINVISGGNTMVLTDSQYSISTDGKTITPIALVEGDVVEVEYEYEKTTHDIYQVAMFDGKDPETSKMFNISGIGPITKDKNTGMRVSWSITF